MIRTITLLSMFMLLATGIVSAESPTAMEREATVKRTTEPVLVVENQDTSALDDGSFENGTPSPYWTEASTKYGTPICTVAACGDHVRTGTGYVWFGGVRDAVEIASLAQSIVIEPHTSLVGWLKIMSDEGRGTLRVQVDGQTVREIDHTDLDRYGQWSRVRIDLDQYADGESHRLSIDVTTAPEGLISFYIDDLSLVETPPTAVQMTMQKTQSSQPVIVIVVAFVSLLIATTTSRGRYVTA